MRKLGFAAVAAFLQLLVLSAAVAEPIVLKFGHIGGPGSLYYTSAEEFARRVAKETNGAVQIALYPKSGLGTDTKVLKKLLTGEVDISLVGTPITSVSDTFGVFEMPFLIRDRDQVKRFRDRLVFGYLSPSLKEKGYLLLGMWELGFRHITNNQRPIYGPESLKGLKLRVPNSPWRIKIYLKLPAWPGLRPDTGGQRIARGLHAFCQRGHNHHLGALGQDAWWYHSYAVLPGGNGRGDTETVSRAL